MGQAQTDPYGDDLAGLDQTMTGLELMAENLTGYRELLCVLEATIELNGFFTNYGKPIHDRFNRIEGTIIPKITREPANIEELERHEIADEIQRQHNHMSIYAAESVAEYWLDQ